MADPSTTPHPPRHRRRTGDAAVRIRGLRVVRGGRAILDGLDLDLPSQQVVGLLGPSGSGKTTLMRTVVGVQVVAGGEVEVLGLPAGDVRLRRRVAYTTQDPSVYADLTARASQHVGTLSGGETSRVSLAMALLGSPELLVLDEPTVGLDPVLRRDLWDLFGRLRDAGRSLLVSSHVMDEAARCDRLLLMRAGTVLADSTLPELLAATGTADAEAAFLHLIDAAERAA